MAWISAHTELIAPSRATGRCGRRTHHGINYGRLTALEPPPRSSALGGLKVGKSGRLRLTTSEEVPSRAFDTNDMPAVRTGGGDTEAGREDGVQTAQASRLAGRYHGIQDRTRALPQQWLVLLLTPHGVGTGIVGGGIGNGVCKWLWWPRGGWCRFLNTMIVNGTVGSGDQRGVTKRFAKTATMVVVNGTTCPGQPVCTYTVAMPPPTLPVHTPCVKDNRTSKGGCQCPGNGAE